MNKTILFFISGPCGTEAVVDNGDPIPVEDINGILKSKTVIRDTMPSDGKIYESYAYTVVTKNIEPPKEACAV